MKVVSSVLVLAVFVSSSGCSSLVQVPRAEFAAAPERKNVLIRTDEGEQYAFDKVAVTADSLSGTGYQQRTVVRGDGESMIEEVETHVQLPLDRIVSFQERKKDWGRAAKWGVGAAAAGALVIAVGTSKGNDDGAQPGGGKGPPVDF